MWKMMFMAGLAVTSMASMCMPKRDADQAQKSKDLAAKSQTIAVAQGDQALEDFFMEQAKQARAGGFWQKNLLEWAAQTSAQAPDRMALGIGLFSTSGFVDDGQIWSVATLMPRTSSPAGSLSLPDAESIPRAERVEAWKGRYVAKGARTTQPEWERDLPVSLRWSEVRSALSMALPLPDYDPSIMDGIQYELLIVEAKGGQLTIRKRLFMNNPLLLDPPAAEAASSAPSSAQAPYVQIIRALKALEAGS